MRKTIIAIVPLLLAATAWADEAADRAAITRTVALVNEPSQRAMAFAKASSVINEMMRLARAFPMTMRLSSVQMPPLDEHPTVIISHEPWGEATIGMPPLVMPAIVPQVDCMAIQFVSADVAIADGTARMADRIETAPVVFVMLRENGEWKIGSLRVMKAKPDGVAVRQ
jgi:hypothetical protein